MVLAVTILSMAAFAVAALALPVSQALRLRETTGLSPPNISANVFNHDGEDITSSFEFMVYHEPKTILQKNLTNRQSPLSRAMTSCPVPRTTFIRSFCDPETWVVGTLQRYSIVCEREPGDPWIETATRTGIGSIVTTGHSAPIGSTIIERTGYCNLDEICITTSRHTTEANCVKTTYFHRIMASWTGVPSAMQIVNTMAQGDTRQALGLGLGGTRATVMISDLNGTTPMEVDTFRVQSGISSLKGQRDDQTTKCRDCSDLETDRLKPNTDFLKTEARLLTTGGAVGILWLVFMSG